jgi:hypothetical protein
VNSTRPHNIILAQLPADEYAALAKHLVPVELPLEKRLSEPNQPIEFVYFLNTGLISTDAVTLKGEQVEVGVIGREGFSGLPALLDQPQMSHSVIIQGSGEGLRIRSAAVSAPNSSRAGCCRSWCMPSPICNWCRSPQAYLRRTPRTLPWMLTLAAGA